MAVPRVAGLCALLCVVFDREKLPVSAGTMRLALAQLATSPGHHDSDRGFGVLQPLAKLNQFGCGWLINCVRECVTPVGSLAPDPAYRATATSVDLAALQLPEGWRVEGDVLVRGCLDRSQTQVLTFAPMVLADVEAYVKYMVEALDTRAKHDIVLIGLNKYATVAHADINTAAEYASKLPNVIIVPFSWTTQKVIQMSDQKNVPVGLWRYACVAPKFVRDVIAQFDGQNSYVHIADSDIGR